MKKTIEIRSEKTMDSDVTDFLERVNAMEEATAFIGFVIDKDDKASTIVCANPLHILGLIQELYGVLGQFMGPTKDDTIQ